VSVTVSAGPEAPATAATIELRRPDGSLAATGALGAAISVPGASPAGMWTLSVTGADGHYVINKTSGPDTGIYVTWLTYGESTISGTVTRGGQPLTGPVAVELLDAANNVIASIPGVTGAYSFPKLLPGTYSVRVVTPLNWPAPAPQTRTVWCTVDAQANVDIPNRPPTVTLTAPPSINEAAPAVNLGAIANDPDGDPITITWTQSGPGVLTPSGASATFSNDDGPASTTVTVTVKDTFNASASDSKTVQTINVNPVANAGPDQSQYWGLPVNFSGSATDVSNADTAAGFTFSWTFGDGGNATGANVSHAYANPGGYTATLTAKDKDNGTGSDTAAVTINKRGTSLAYTGPTSATFGPGVVLTATLSDVVDVPTQQLSGKTVNFTVDGSIVLTGTTGPSGGVSVTTPMFLMPGAHTIAVAFAGDSHYLASSAQGSCTVVNTTGVQGYGLNAEVRQQRPWRIQRPV
jgi:hypothetical protein